VNELTLRLYSEGSAHPNRVGIIVRRHQVRFGLLPAVRRQPPGRGSHHPDRRNPDADSSRFLAAGQLQPGGAQKSFDKLRARYPRRIAEQDAAGPPPCPTTSSSKTRDKYIEALPP